MHTTSKRRLRVVHVTPGLDLGGLEKLLVELGRHTDRTRFDLHFVSLGGRGVLAEQVEACGWPVTALEEPDGLRPKLVLRLVCLLCRAGADVVHTHDDRAHLYGTFAARLAGVPRVIHTRHGRSPHLTRRQRVLVNVASGLVDHFACVSDDSRRLARRQGVSPRKLCTVWNGIDPALFRGSGGRPGGPAVIVARLSPEKDVETLLRASALVAAADSSFLLEVAGDGPCLPALRQTAAALGLDGRVRFLGPVHDVPELLARAGLFVLSSRSEGVALTLLEAMASGLAVVATRVGGNPEVVQDGETGLLVPAGDAAALAAALLRLRGDVEACARMGRAGRRHVERCFDVRRMVRDYQAMYQGVNNVNLPANAL